MCEPISIALGAAQAGLAIKGQSAAAKAQGIVQQRASKAEQERYLSQLNAERINQAQERVAAAKRVQAAASEGAKARATAIVAAGEAGVAGISVDALERDIQREQAEFRFGVQQQLEFNDVARNFAFQDARMSTTMNQLRINQPIDQPNYLGAVLGGVQTGLNTYDVTKDMTFKNPFK